MVTLDAFLLPATFQALSSCATNKDFSMIKKWDRQVGFQLSVLKVDMKIGYPKVTLLLSMQFKVEIDDYNQCSEIIRHICSILYRGSFKSRTGLKPPVSFKLYYSTDTELLTPRIFMTSLGRWSQSEKGRNRGHSGKPSADTKNTLQGNVQR